MGSGRSKHTSLPASTFLRLHTHNKNEPYAFTHYIFVTRTYRLSAADASAMAIEVDSSEAASRPSKRRKNRPQVQAAQQQGPGTYSFHPEDECIQKVCVRVHVRQVLAKLTACD